MSILQSDSYIRARKCECGNCVGLRRDFFGAFYNDRGDTPDRLHAVGESRGWSWAERASNVQPMVVCKEPGCDVAVRRAASAGMPRRYCDTHAARAAVNRRYRESTRIRVDRGRREAGGTK